MDKFSRLRFLFAKYLRRQCSPEDVEELIILLQQAEAEEALTEEMQLLWEESRKNKIPPAVDWNEMYASVLSKGEHTDRVIKRAVNRNNWLYWVIAAVFLLAISLVVYWFIGRSSFGKHNKQHSAFSNTKTAISYEKEGEKTGEICWVYPLK